MNHTTERDDLGTPVARGETGAAPRRWLFPVMLQLVAMIGIAALLYPSAADWFASLNHDSALSGYVESLKRLPDGEREALLESAREYNAHMSQGTLRDPYSSDASRVEQDGAYQSYLDTVNVSENGVIGEINYPSLKINLPIYHGTSEAALTNGAGHLYGTSLPVGGASTHSVLTSHSGLLNASLFTELPKAKLGEIFFVSVLGETQFYRVDQVETVLPAETEGLRVVDGADYMTLITCTPIGINSHRILVRGTRVPAPLSQSPSTAVAGDGKQAGFPWWALGFLGGSAVTAYLLFVPPKPKKRFCLPVARLNASKDQK